MEEKHKDAESFWEDEKMILTSQFKDMALQKLRAEKELAMERDRVSQMEAALAEKEKTILDLRAAFEAKEKSEQFFSKRHTRLEKEKEKLNQLVNELTSVLQRVNINTQPTSGLNRSDESMVTNALIQKRLHIEFKADRSPVSSQPDSHPDIRTLLTVWNDERSRLLHQIELLQKQPLHFLSEKPLVQVEPVDTNRAASPVGSDQLVSGSSPSAALHLKQWTRQRANNLARHAAFPSSHSPSFSASSPQLMAPLTTVGTATTPSMRVFDLGSSRNRSETVSWKQEKQLAIQLWNEERRRWTEETNQLSSQIHTLKQELGVLQNENLLLQHDKDSSDAMRRAMESRFECILLRLRTPDSTLNSETESTTAAATVALKSPSSGSLLSKGKTHLPIKRQSTMEDEKMEFLEPELRRRAGKLCFVCHELQEFLSERRSLFAQLEALKQYKLFMDKEHDQLVESKSALEKQLHELTTVSNQEEMRWLVEKQLLIEAHNQAINQFTVMMESAVAIRDESKKRLQAKLSSTDQLA
eukprot:GILK01012834.1.p1 GENE.GILK01012834.1~~GILK01012834.1.p1  ORF type:complete len:573 (+),score=173.51 GILK01012834.1:137-1720(+)